MARNELFFSTRKLLSTGLISLFGCSFLAVLAMEVQAGGRVRGLGFLRLLGQDGPFWFAVIVATLGIVICLASFRRLLGGRLAAAIRHDGIELSGVFLSRHIPWRSLDRLGLRSFRLHGTFHHAIRIESRCPRGGNAVHHFLASLSHGVSTGLLAASDEEVAGWLANAGAAHRAVVGPPRPLPRSRPLTHAPAGRPRIGFGRRPG